MDHHHIHRAESRRYPDLRFLDWVQARSLGVYQMIFAGGMAAGSALWGLLAEHFSNRTALLLAAAGIAD